MSESGNSSENSCKMSLLQLEAREQARQAAERRARFERGRSHPPPTLIMPAFVDDLPSVSSPPTMGAHESMEVEREPLPAGCDYAQPASPQSSMNTSMSDPPLPQCIQDIIAAHFPKLPTPAKAAPATGSVPFQADAGVPPPVIRVVAPVLETNDDSATDEELSCDAFYFNERRRIKQESKRIVEEHTKADASKRPKIETPATQMFFAPISDLRPRGLPSDFEDALSGGEAASPQLEDIEMAEPVCTPPPPSSSAPSPSVPIPTSKSPLFPVCTEGSPLTPPVPRSSIPPSDFSFPSSHGPAFSAASPPTVLEELPRIQFTPGGRIDPLEPGHETRVTSSTSGITYSDILEVGHGFDEQGDKFHKQGSQTVKVTKIYDVLKDQTPATFRVDEEILLFEVMRAQESRALPKLQTRATIGTCSCLGPLFCADTMIANSDVILGERGAFTNEIQATRVLGSRANPYRKLQNDIRVCHAAREFSGQTTATNNLSNNTFIASSATVGNIQAKGTMKNLVRQHLQLAFQSDQPHPAWNPAAPPAFEQGGPLTDVLLNSFLSRFQLEQSAETGDFTTAISLLVRGMCQLDQCIAMSQCLTNTVNENCIVNVASRSRFYARPGGDIRIIRPGVTTNIDGTVHTLPLRGGSTVNLFPSNHGARGWLLTSQNIVFSVDSMEDFRALLFMDAAFTSPEPLTFFFDHSLPERPATENELAERLRLLREIAFDKHWAIAEAQLLEQQSSESSKAKNKIPVATLMEKAKEDARIRFLDPANPQGPREQDLYPWVVYRAGDVPSAIVWSPASGNTPDNTNAPGVSTMCTNALDFPDGPSLEAPELPADPLRPRDIVRRGYWYAAGSESEYNAPCAAVCGVLSPDLDIDRVLMQLTQDEREMVTVQDLGMPGVNARLVFSRAYHLRAPAQNIKAILSHCLNMVVSQKYVLPEPQLRGCVYGILATTKQALLTHLTTPGIADCAGRQANGFLASAFPGLSTFNSALGEAYMVHGNSFLATNSILDNKRMLMRLETTGDNRPPLSVLPSFATFFGASRDARQAAIRTYCLTRRIVQEGSLFELSFGKHLARIFWSGNDLQDFATRYLEAVPNFAVSSAIKSILARSTSRTSAYPLRVLASTCYLLSGSAADLENFSTTNTKVKLYTQKFEVGPRNSFDFFLDYTTTARQHIRNIVGPLLYGANARVEGPFSLDPRFLQAMTKVEVLPFWAASTHTEANTIDMIDWAVKDSNNNVVAVALDMSEANRIAKSSEVLVLQQHQFFFGMAMATQLARGDNADNRLGSQIGIYSHIVDRDTVMTFEHGSSFISPALIDMVYPANGTYRRGGTEASPARGLHIAQLNHTARNDATLVEGFDSILQNQLLTYDPLGHAWTSPALRLDRPCHAPHIAARMRVMTAGKEIAPQIKEGRFFTPGGSLAAGIAPTEAIVTLI